MPKNKYFTRIFLSSAVVKQMSSTSWAATELHSRDSTRPGTGPGMGPVRGLRKSSGLRVLTGPGLQCMYYIRRFCQAEIERNNVMAILLISSTWTWPRSPKSRP